MSRSRPIASLATLAAGATLATLAVAAPLAASHTNPILFVSQVPIPSDFVAIGAVFGNAHADMASVGRGGDLYLLMPNGTLKNLTGLAGLGVASGFQNDNSIAVRDPAVSFDAKKALFSMATGAPVQFQWESYYWQIYEVTNLDLVISANATPNIVLVPNQPANYNNVTPFYLPNGRIGFTSDRPRNGAAHLYPQLDEYEEAATVTGIWSMDRTVPGGDLKLLDHSPSGDFTPILDSFGRIIFTRWDHMQRDQQADTDALDPNDDPYGTFNWSSESSAAVALADRTEVYPEPRSPRTDLLLPYEEGLEFNGFFPWMLNPDGTGLETINHIGRHELAGYFNRNRHDDPNIDEFICGDDSCGRPNLHEIRNILEMREIPTGNPGTYVGIDAPEFYTNASGQIVSLPLPAGANPDLAVASWLTHPDTANFDDTPGPCHSGLYRNPLPLKDNTLIAVHAGERSAGVPETRQAANDGTRALPVARYRFRMVDLVADSGGCAGYKKYGANLTPGIVKSLSYYDPDVLVTYTNVTMWELSPVEVVSRTPPPILDEPLPAIEAGVFAAEGVDPNVFRQFLVDRDLALIVSRDVTTRDQADRQQPWQLRIEQSGGQQTPPVGQTTGTVYPIKYFQLMQGDLIRGLHGPDTPGAGRRVIAQPMHDGGPNPPARDGSAPLGSVELEADGSMAALVPAHRALSWQTVSDANDVAVRERFWLTFGAGEMRVCADCHGVNTADQHGDPAATNEPQALHRLLQYWKNWLFSDDFEIGTTGRWSAHNP
jgi:hypothetical protein